MSMLQLLRHGQRLLVYPSGFDPHPRYVVLPNQYNLPYEDVELRTKDKTTLRCYLIRQPPKDSEEASKPARGTVIMFHGNAMNHGDILPAARQFFTKGFSVFTLEYRGYGLSEGYPSESGLRLDAQAGLDYVLADPSLSSKPVIIYGQSLGGGVAVDVTSRNADKIAALIIENTFTSIPNLVKEWPIIGSLYFLCTQKWKSASKIEKLSPTLPILMLSGLMDEVIPEHHMRDLWEVAKTRGNLKGKTAGESDTWKPPERDQFENFPYGSHNNTWIQAGYWDAIYEFLDDVCQTCQTNAPTTS